MAYAPAPELAMPQRDTRSVTPDSSPKLRPAKIDSNTERNTPDEMETEPENDRAPSTPTGPTQKSSNSQTHLTAHIFTNTPLRPSATSVPFTLSKNLPDVFLPATPPTRLPPSVPRSSGRKRSGLVPSSKVTHVIAGLDRQIGELSSLIDGLRSERERLLPVDIPTRVRIFFWLYFRTTDSRRCYSLGRRGTLRQRYLTLGYWRRNVFGMTLIQMVRIPTDCPPGIQTACSAANSNRSTHQQRDSWSTKP